MRGVAWSAGGDGGADGLAPSVWPSSAVLGWLTLSATRHPLLNGPTAVVSWRSTALRPYRRWRSLKSVSLGLPQCLPETAG